MISVRKNKIFNSKTKVLNLKINAFFNADKMFLSVEKIPFKYSFLF
jgi:hypothetical protein